MTQLTGDTMRTALTLAVVASIGILSAPAGASDSAHHHPPPHHHNAIKTTRVSPAPANWTRPAHFTVGTSIASPNPGPFSATNAGEPINSLFHSGGFEPIMIRRRYSAQNGTAGDTIVLTPESLSEYDEWTDGWLDGATARVYRLDNGKISLRRTDTIVTTKCSGWNGANALGGNMVTVTSFSDQVPPWFRPNTTLWYAVQAVDHNGNVSALSEAVKVVNVPLPPKGASSPSNTVAPRPKLDTNNPNSTVPPTPTGLQASVDATHGTVKLSWTAVKGWPSLVGYVVVTGYVSPDAMQGYSLELAASQGGPAVAPGDLIFVDRKDYSFNRTHMSPRIWNAQGGSNPGMLGFEIGPDRNHGVTAYNGEGDGLEWTLVSHPSPVPADLAPQAGETCVKVTVDTTPNPLVVSLGSGGVSASTTQAYYPVLRPGITYTMEFWARTDDDNRVDAPHTQTGAITTLPLTAEFGPSPDNNADNKALVYETVNITSTWQHFQFNFSTPWVYNTSGAVQSASLSWTVPGSTLYLDNWRMYEQGTGFMEMADVDAEALKVSGLAYLRTHAFIKSTYGYDMTSLTNPPGVTQYQYNGACKTLHTLTSMFNVMRSGNTHPWLQVEQFMSESELLGLAEFLAAPYDPSKDTPTTKPWASKRYAQGQPAPYTDVFSKFMYEISNEEWNRMFMPWGFPYGSCMPDHTTGETVCEGALLGLWQEKTVVVLRSSPYWTADVEAKFTFVVGGWAVSDGGSNAWHDGYGTNAAVRSPSTSIVNIAGYNGGWDAGEAAAVPNDYGFFKALSFTEQNADPVSALMAAVRANLSHYNATKIHDGTYEAGPGYNMNGLNGVKMNASQVEAESQVMKSLAAGTATLDSFLMRAQHGFVVQNFFTFSRNRYYWTSHAPLTSGGQAYPSWKALSLYNVNGTGDFLDVTTVSVPTHDLNGTARRPTVPDAPMVAVYATATASSNVKTVNVFVLSRKLDNYPYSGDDGYTPVTLSLPFASAGRITRYRLAGDPRQNNLDADNVKLEVDDVPSTTPCSTFTLSKATGADDRGISPGAVYMYTFEDTKK